MKHRIIQNTLFLAIFLIANIVSAQNQISGIVNYHENEENPLPFVTVELFDTENNMIATTITSDIGEFTFSNIPTGEYILRSSTSLHVGEINIVDASLILYYIFGMYTFNEYEFLAADVNGNGRVNFGDYMRMIRYIMRGNSFPAGEWQFNEVSVNLASRDNIDTTYICGTSTGDVEGIWMPAGRNIGLDYDYNQNNIDISEQMVELEIGSDYNELISGFNLNLTYPVDLIEIVDVTGPDENFHFNLDGNTGILNVIWLDENKKPGTTFFGETLFRVKVKQLDNSTQSKEGAFSLLEKGMVLDNNSNQIEDVTINLPKITTTSSSLTFELTSYPNPVVNNLSFKITSPENNYADIYIYDMVGKLVHTTIGTNVYKGTQLINIETKNLPSGQYLYKVVIPNIEIVAGSFSKTN